MTAGLEVVAPGLATTVQDLGRFGYQHAGVPVSGALDPVSLRLANLLAGNPEDMAGLEVLFQGPTLAVRAESVRVAMAGASLEILDDPPRTVAPWRSMRLERGQRVRIGAPTGGATGYLAVEGGFALDPTLGSLSTYVRGGFGGLDGRALAAGDLVPLARASVPTRQELGLARPDLPQPERYRVMLGPQSERFTEAGLETLLSASFTVSAASDRMGMRLDGPAIAHAAGYDLISDGIAPGAIQVPGSGHPIVLQADRQTTGGYPKIATVISADLPALGRLAPGATVAFEPVSREAAEAARAAFERHFAKLKAGIRPVAEQGEINEAHLFTANLVSGVVDGRDA